MKIAKWVTVEQEIEVDVSAEDIATALYAENDSAHQVMQGVNNFARYCKAIKPETIEELKDTQRAVIADFLRKEADRYLSNATLSNKTHEKKH